MIEMNRTRGRKQYHLCKNVADDIHYRATFCQSSKFVRLIRGRDAIIILLCWLLVKELLIRRNATRLALCYEGGG